MAQTIEYDIRVNDGGAVRSIQQIEGELQDLNAEIKKVDPNSDAFKVAAKNIQGLEQELENVNKAVKGLTFEDKVRGIDGAVKVLGGSLQATVGALGTLGIESEALGKFEEKAASVIALGIGLKDLSEGFAQLAPFLKDITKLTKTFNAAVLANPVVLFTAAIAGLVGGFAKLVSVGTDDVVPTMEVLENMFLSLGNAADFATRMAVSYANNLEALASEDRINQMERSIAVMAAFGQNTLDLELQLAEDRLKALKEGEEGYEDALRATLVLRAKVAKKAGEDQATAERTAYEKRLKELQDKWALEAEAEGLNAEFYETLGVSAAQAYADAFETTIKEEFDPMKIIFDDGEFDEVTENLFGPDGFVTKFREGLGDALDETIASEGKWNQFADVAGEAFGYITDLSQQFYDRQLLNLERERSTIESNTKLSEEQRLSALSAVEQKEKELEIRRIKAERDQFTIKQTLLIAEEIMRTKFFVQQQIQQAQLQAAIGATAVTAIATEGAVQAGKASMSLGSFVAQLGPLGIAAFAVTIGGIIASIVSARKRANDAIKALNTGTTSSGAGSSGIVSLPSPAQMGTSLGTAPETMEQQPLRAYVLSGDVKNGFEASAKMSQLRTLN